MFAAVWMRKRNRVLGSNFKQQNDGNEQKWSKIVENTRKWSRRVVKESKGEAKGAKRELIGSQREPKGAKRAPK